jgi:diacylglycerol kinase
VGAIKDMGSAAVFCTLALAALAWGAALIQLIGL